MKAKLKTENRRAIILFSFCCLLFAALAVRIAFIQSGKMSAAADIQFSKRIKLGETRGYIYDVNRVPLVNSTKNKKTAFISCPDSETLFQKSLQQNKICSGICVTTDTDGEYRENNVIKNYYTVDRYRGDKLCPHIIGYINSDGSGVCGIEKAFDRLLKDAGGELFLNFSADALGKALAGDGLKTESINYDSPAGIALTIDKNIQQITENALKNSDITRGAAVVLNTDTFRIAAAASVPDFDPYNLETALKSEFSPFINRAFSAYPVGSVFKPFVAAAAIENGWNEAEELECKGEISVGGNSFTCYNSKAHGKQRLFDAVCHSCNTFFIELGLKAGKENLIETAERFGFGQKTQLCTSIVSAPGNLPDAESISSDAQTANLCFGQGELLATPLQIAAAYAVIANGGVYIEPSLLSELINSKGEAYGYYTPEISRRAAGENTCALLRECLYGNMLNGTGKNGQPCNTSAAGKTATAQTGIYEKNGRERLCTWFAGFFPYETPAFSIAVFNENGSTASEDCAPVFKEIAENIVSLYSSNQKVF